MSYQTDKKSRMTDYSACEVTQRDEIYILEGTVFFKVENFISLYQLIE